MSIFVWGSNFFFPNFREKLANTVRDKVVDTLGEELVSKIRKYLVALVHLVARIGEYVVVLMLEYLVAPIGSRLDYLLFYESNIEKFWDEIENLIELRAKVKGLVKAAETEGEVVLPNVLEWLKGVDKIIKESKDFSFDELQVSLKLRYQRGRDAKKKTADVDELKRDGRNFNRVSYNTTPPAIESISVEDVEVFESRKLIFRRIMKALNNDEFNCIGIYGTSGVGKTTLAKVVIQQAKDDNLFDAIVMALVSKPPDFRRLQGEIADVLGLKFETNSQSRRARQISAALKDKKRILVILDDIRETVELDAIGIPFGAKHKGCKIVLTSQSRDVLNQMDTEKNFHIKVLANQEGWHLFQKMARESVDSPDIHDVAVKIAKECADLPIAIMTVARALTSKSFSVWRDAANKLRKKVFSPLELSYNHLESEEAKSFFLLCCLYPEDHSIPILDLLKYGMGLGLFQGVDTVDRGRERARALAYSLKYSCLLGDGGNEEHVKMHNVIRQVGISIASRDEHVFLVRAGPQWSDLPRSNTFKRCTAISLISDNFCKLPSEWECPKLETLLLECPNPSLQFPDNFFSKMTNLKVLGMSGMHVESLPPSIRELINLQTLSLNHCNLGNISFIKALQNLKILSFVGSGIKKLPEEIGSLTNLRLLDLTQCEELTRIPPDVIQRLSQLEGLYIDRSFDKWETEREDSQRSRNASLAELQHLSKLINLEIHVSEADLLPEDLSFEKLSRFKISIGTSFGRLEHFSHSKVLKLELDVSSALKGGIKELMKKAEFLHLMKLKGLKSVLYGPETEGFPDLRCLGVERCSEMEYISNSSEWVPAAKCFSVLEVLSLSCLPNLKEVCCGQIPTAFFSNLTVVVVWRCDRLKNLFSHSIAKNLSKLVKMTVTECDNMEVVVGNEEEAAAAAAAAAMDDTVFPDLRYLVLKDLPNLKSFSKMTRLARDKKTDTETEEPLFGKKVAFTNLEVLRIINVDNLREIFHSQFPNESLTQLKILEVQGCHELSRVAPSNLLPWLKKLEQLVVQGCSKMEEVFKLEGPVGEEHTDMSLSMLKKVELRDLPNLTIFCSGNSNFEFPSLETLSLVECSKMQRFSSSSTSPLKLNSVRVEFNKQCVNGDLNSIIRHLFQ